MTEPQNPHKVLKDELMSAYMEAGEQQREKIAELRKFRAQTPLITITLLTAVTPFAKDYTNFMLAFFVGYVLLFASTILGILGIEGLLRYEIKSFGRFQQQTRIVIEEFKKKKDIKDALAKFEASSKDDDLDEQLFNHFSDLSIKFLVIGLVILFISVFPWQLLVEFFKGMRIG